MNMDFWWFSVGICKYKPGYNEILSSGLRILQISTRNLLDISQIRKCKKGIHLR